MFRNQSMFPIIFHLDALIRMSVQVSCDQTVPRPVVMARPQELQFTNFIMPVGRSVRRCEVPFAAIMTVLLPGLRSNSF